MKLLDVAVNCKSRSDRVEIFPFFDMHVGKANCNEAAIQKQVQEIAKRREMPNRHVLTLLGGDAMNAISPSDRKRFDFSDVADWLIDGTKEEIKDALADMPRREINRVNKLLSPIKDTIVGALEGNHEKSLRKYHNMDVQAALCEKLECENLSDEALIRLRFKRQSAGAGMTSLIYMRHGYGGGRKDGAEPTKLSDMRAEWECADVCLSGHTHTFCVAPPKAVASIPRKGKLPDGLLWHHRFAANPGCWLDSHYLGRGTYESQACYPARAFMTCKIVIWPFFELYQNRKGYAVPKIELRSYPIL
jgi:hypothetical protein